MTSGLSILIPTYNGDCRQMVGALTSQLSSLNSDTSLPIAYEIIVADDGSTDRHCVELCREVEQLPHCRFIDRGVNSGRAAIRNFLARESHYEWLLFMDCDMTIVSDDFIRRYLEWLMSDSVVRAGTGPATTKGSVVYGGYVVGKGEESCLRYIYERQCAPQHTVEERRKRPFMHFHTCNFLVPREVMLQHPFDERFRHYGYEDVLWGKQLERAGITITHLDNPAGFCTFEDNDHFVAKTEEGLQTLHHFRDELRGYSQMIAFIDGIRFGVVRAAIRLWHRLFGGMERRNLCGPHPSLRLFSLYKLGYYISL